LKPGAEMNHVKNTHNIMHGLKALFFYFLLKLTAIFKVSFIVGSRMAFFSAANVLHPVVGRFLGVSGSCWWFAISTIFRFFVGTASCLNLVHGIPSFCAALYMSSSHILIRLILPLVCMILFIAHPVGFQAAPYSFYWLIPMILYFVKKESFFKDALGATFVAHAVGSVFWLYLVPMPVAYWWGLIPVVAVERLIFATGAVCVYSGITYSLPVLDRIKKRGWAIAAHMVG